MIKKFAIRDAFGEALVELGEKNEKVVVLDADVSCSTRTIKFGERFPHRFFNLGVAEANMMNIAAGLATCGFIPFCL
ncbi:1-deoxy-D-xylulose-5-phosphate synthase [subsurface metagenome]